MSQPQRIRLAVGLIAIAALAASRWPQTSTPAFIFAALVVLVLAVGLRP